jgi:hypothetical protein
MAITKIYKGVQQVQKVYILQALAQMHGYLVVMHQINYTFMVI